MTLLARLSGAALLLLALASIPGSVFPQRGTAPLRVNQYLVDHPRLGPVLDQLHMFDVFASAWFGAVVAHTALQHPERAPDAARFFSRWTTELWTLNLLRSREFAQEALDHAGIAVSTGSACISGSREPSEALLAMGLDEERSRGGLRITFGATTTLDEARFAGELVRSVLSRIRTAVPA